MRPTLYWLLTASVENLQLLWKGLTNIRYVLYLSLSLSAMHVEVTYTYLPTVWKCTESGKSILAKNICMIISKLLVSVIQFT